MPTDKELIKKFLLHGKRKNWSKNTIVGYKRDLNNFVKRHPGLLKLDHRDIDDWILEEMERGLEPASI